MISLPSHVGDGAFESCWRWRCRGDIGCGVRSLSSSIGDGTTEAILVVASCHCRVMLVMALPSLAGDGAA
jgi:hypothetical protein